MHALHLGEKDLRRLVVDPQECAGCRQCEMVCSFLHTGVFSPKLSGITVLKVDKYGFDYPVFCRQCPDCPSLEACPTMALTRDADGIIRVDQDICIGCGECVEACKFEAINTSPGGKPVICDLCGGIPACVSRCPTQALSFVDSEGFYQQPEDALKEFKERWGMNG